MQHEMEDNLKKKSKIQIETVNKNKKGLQPNLITLNTQETILLLLPEEFYHTIIHTMVSNFRMTHFFFLKDKRIKRIIGGAVIQATVTVIVYLKQHMF